MLTLTSLLTASLILLLIDIPWLLFQSSASQKMVAGIQGSPLRFRLWSAIPVYLALGYLLLQQTSVQGAAASGLCVYAVYDFTNYAIFEQYPLSFAIQDTLWGGVLFAAAFWLLRKIR